MEKKVEDWWVGAYRLMKTFGDDFPEAKLVAGELRGETDVACRGERGEALRLVLGDAHGRPARPEELADHNCLVQSRTSRPQSVWSFLDAGKKVSVSVSGDRTADDGGLLREWAVAGGGVVLKSDYDVVNDLRAGRLEAVLPEFADQDVNLYAVHVAGRHPTRRGQSFIDYLIAEMTYKV